MDSLTEIRERLTLLEDALKEVKRYIDSTPSTSENVGGVE